MEYHIENGNTELLDLADQHRDAIILLDFYADWCGPCKAISPKLHDLVKEYAQGYRRLLVFKVNVEDEGNEDLCSAYKIRAMPTFVWIANKKVVHRLEGANYAAVSNKTAELCIPHVR